MYHDIKILVIDHNCKLEVGSYCRWYFSKFILMLLSLSAVVKCTTLDYPCICGTSQLLLIILPPFAPLQACMVF